MTHILRTSTEHKTASLADEGNSAYCQSSGAHNIKHTYKPMEINIERSPQHWCPSEDSNSELFAHENDTIHSKCALAYLKFLWKISTIMVVM